MTAQRDPRKDWRNRFAFEVQMDIRFDGGLFVFEGTLNERKARKSSLAVWWPHFYVRLLGIGIGIGLFIGKENTKCR
jgi:hypothetical protein